MNSIEKLIQTKLASALTEEKQRIAVRLVKEGPMDQTVPMGQTAPNSSDAASVNVKKQAKQDQIDTMQQAISDLKSKAGTAKNPEAFQNALKAKKDKLDALRKDLANIR